MSFPALPWARPSMRCQTQGTFLGNNFLEGHENSPRNIFHLGTDSLMLSLRVPGNPKQFSSLGGNLELRTDSWTLVLSALEVASGTAFE